MPTNMAWPRVFSQESDGLVLLRFFTILLGVLLSAAAAPATAAATAALATAAIAVSPAAVSTRAWPLSLLHHHIRPLHRRS